MATPLLDNVHLPADLRGLSDADLSLLADELRSEVIAIVSETGGRTNNPRRRFQLYRVSP